MVNKQLKNKLLNIGILLWLLGPLCSLATKAEDWVYYAKDGDTLWHLCLTYTNKRGCWIELARYNQIDHDRRIPINSPIKFPLSWLKQSPVVGKVLYVNGEAFYKLNNRQSETLLEQGQLLHLGAVLKTGEGSAVLLLDNRHQVLVRADSVLELSYVAINQKAASESDRQAEITLQLNQGSIESQVKKAPKTRFQIQTPTAIAAVRGTVFRVTSEGDQGTKMRAEVLEGAVAVAVDKQSAELSPGYGISVTKGETLAEPKKLLAAPKFTGDYSATQLPVEISWTEDEKAVSYQLDLLTADNGGLLLSQQLQNPNFVLSELEQGCYQLDISATDSDGLQGVNARAPLCIYDRPAAPSLDEGVRVKGSKDVSFTWSQVADAASYEVQVASDEAFTQNLRTYQTEVPDILLSGLAKQTFYVRVVAISDKGIKSESSNAVMYKSENGLLAFLFAVVIIVAATL